jgi:putative Mn2+ efflux pump MntP
MFNKLVSQGKLALISIIIGITCMFIIVNYNNEIKEKNKTVSIISLNIILLLIVVIVGIYVVFEINCMVTGNQVKNCGILSWLLVIRVFIISIITILYGLYLYKNNKIGNLHQIYL